MLCRLARDPLEANLHHPSSERFRSLVSGCEVPWGCDYLRGPCRSFYTERSSFKSGLTMNEMAAMGSKMITQEYNEWTEVSTFRSDPVLPGYRNIQVE